MIEIINPATGKKINSYSVTTTQELNQLLDRLSVRQPQWKKTSISERQKWMKKTAEVLRKEKGKYSQLITAEMGKPIGQSESEIEKCAWVCEYYAEHAGDFLKNETVLTEARQSYVAFEPLGTVLAIMPWNFPFWQAFRAAVPALMAGNVMLLKHASNVTGCAFGIRDIFRAAGFPEGCFETVVLPSSQVASLIEDPRIQGVTLTGSVPAGRSVAEAAGRVLKKTVLELGGSDPYLILEDADLEKAAEACAYSRLINGGQSCIAAKRFIVVESVRKSFEELFVQAMIKRKWGNPLDATIQIGPMARFDLREELHQQVEKSIQQGARLLTGGKIPDDPGAYYPPTVLTNVVKGMITYQEETFGPVASIIGTSNEKEAIHVANDTCFGLGAAVFTDDLDRGERIASKEIHAGSCFVNTFVKSDPRLPFGGVKDSGYGRELGIYGIREFVNVKTVYIEK